MGVAEEEVIEVVGMMRIELLHCPPLLLAVPANAVSLVPQMDPTCAIQLINYP